MADARPGIDAKPRQLRIRIIAISLSLGTGTALMAAKFYAFHLTGSSAILSDALESIINVVASAFALFSVIMAAKPPDADHPYGHGKIEFFSAGFEGAMIIIAAVGIFAAGWDHLFAPRPLPDLDAGLWLLLIAALVNLVLGIGLVRAGKRTDSLILVADGRHVLTDVYTSGGVLLGLLLVRVTGWLWLDGAIACLVGIQILVTGTALLRQSFSGLMDTSDPTVIARVADLIDRNRRETWIDVHRLRAWQAGNLVHIDFHLILPRDFSLAEAHREIKILERIIVADFQDKASVLIHMDPCEDPDCPACRQAACRLRSAESEKTPLWTPESMTRIVPSAGGGD